MRLPTLLLTGFSLVAVSALIGLLVGASWLSPRQLASALFDQGAGSETWMQAIVLDVRLPRVLLALAIGASLSQGGVVLQALFRNPLAEQSLLGISGGAALAAALWITLPPPLTPAVEWLGAFGLPLAALTGALLAGGAAVRLSRTAQVTGIATLLLAGLSINALAGAGIALLQTLSSDAALRDLTLWFYGSLGRASWSQLALGLPILVAISLWLPREARALDALLLGEAEAAHLGVSVEALKRRLLLLVALAAAIAVALAGIIGFVGLIVPHLLRRVLGPGHRLLLPASALFGAALLTLADTAARTVFAPLEVPVGVLTALLGVPLFLLLLRRQVQQP